MNMRVPMDPPQKMAANYIGAMLELVQEAGWKEQDIARIKQVSDILELALTQRATFIKGDAKIGKFDTSGCQERHAYLTRAQERQLDLSRYIDSFSANRRKEAVTILSEYCSLHANALLMDIDHIVHPRPQQTISDDFRKEIQSGLIKTTHTVNPVEILADMPVIETICLDDALDNVLDNILARGRPGPNTRNTGKDIAKDQWNADQLIQDALRVQKNVLNRGGKDLKEFYDLHLMPSYRATLAEMEKRLKEKPENMSETEFGQANAHLVDHAAFLKDQIRIVRKKYPPVYLQVPTLYAEPVDSLVMNKAKTPLTTTGAATIPFRDLGDAPVSMMNRMTAKLKGWGEKLSSAADRIKNVVTPRVIAGGLMTGATALVAGLALTSFMKSVEPDIQGKPDDSARHTSQAAAPVQAAPQPAVVTQQTIETARETASVPVGPRESVDRKVASLSKPARTPAVTASFNDQSPVEEKEFDVLTFRPSLESLKAACAQAGRLSPDGVCAGFKSDLTNG